ncbi:hypothetical protein PR048_008358 [Dryococelus australis]|uniref:Uncharacterized protein n=1 Tax=Dryococelus australis TaxID=614101 RepID=A0ABQ9HXQ7_9NEOP|nr:hypothetical protein PR048_008358 [Dryococelus australis]
MKPNPSSFMHRKRSTEKVQPRGLSASVVKIATFTGLGRARCVFCFQETKSATQVQRKLRTRYRKEPPSMPTIYSLRRNFVGTECFVVHTLKTGTPHVSEDDVEQSTQDNETCIQGKRDYTDDCAGSIAKTSTLKSIPIIDSADPYRRQ